MYGSKVKFLIEVIIHSLFWLGVYYALQAVTVNSFKLVVNINGKNVYFSGRTIFSYTLVTFGALILLFYGSIFWLFSRGIRRQNRFLDVAVTTGWLFLLFALNYIVIRELIGPATNITDEHQSAAYNVLPGRPLIPRPTPFSVSDWGQMQPVIGAMFLAIQSIAVVYFFIREWIRSGLRRSQAESLQLSTEIRFLRSQINPHFLFNTLNNLFSMAQSKGDDEVADGISKLSGMMRYMIYESNTDLVSLQREIAYLEDCIALNKLRYADSEVAINFRHPGPPVTARVQVAPMLFVPFLENAFKHGVIIGDHSSITIVMQVDPPMLNFTCENTDHSAVRKLGEEKGGIGLENVRRRLELLYPGRHELQAGAEGGKYKVNLQIKFI